MKVTAKSNRIRKAIPAINTFIRNLPSSCGKKYLMANIIKTYKQMKNPNPGEKVTKRPNNEPIIVNKKMLLFACSFDIGIYLDLR
jgi:hypothetical protein